jgi:hypothetical protein
MTIPKSRGGIAGYAWIGTICGSNKYSIIVDNGFNSINVGAVLIKLLITIYFRVFIGCCS